LTLFKLLRQLLPALLAVFLLAMPFVARADADTDFRELARDLAAKIGSEAERLRRQGVDGYTSDTEGWKRIGDAQKLFGTLSQKTASEREIRNAADALGRLAEDGKEIYTSIIDDPELRRRIELSAQSVGLRLFVPEQLITDGFRAIRKLVELGSEQAAVVLAKQKNRGDDEDSPKIRWEMNAFLQEFSQPDNLRLVANRYFSSQLANAIYQQYGAMEQEGYVMDSRLDTELMSYFLDASGPAYDFYRAHAFFDTSDEFALDLGKQYLEKRCRNPEKMSLACFTVLTQSAVTHAQNGRTAHVAGALKVLDDSMKSHKLLQDAVSERGRTSELANKGGNTFVDLLDVVPSMDDIMRGGPHDWPGSEEERVAAAMMEASAISYWIARASGGKIGDLLSSASGSSRIEDRGVALLMGSLIESIQLADYDTTLAAIRAARKVSAGGYGASETLRTLDMLEAHVLYESGQYDRSRKLVAQIVRGHPPIGNQAGKPFAVGD